MTRHRVRWGILGAANIAIKKVIPAMQRGEWSEVVGLASRSASKARHAASALGIPKHYGSYDDLLADPSIEAVYIPLPNHLHVPWAIKAAERGKHVLCEKPIALTALEAESLLVVRDRTGVKIQEAFMIRSHPQWTTAVDLVRNGSLGRIESVAGHFSYFNVDPANVRNVADLGGGGLADIGCYLVHGARWLFGQEPTRVEATMDMDPAFGTDRLTTMQLDFDDARMVGICGTQLPPEQWMLVVGSAGSLAIEIPFNAPTDRPCRVFVRDREVHEGSNRRSIELPVCDQYTLQGDDFSRAIRGESAQTLPLEDSIANLRVLDAIRRSAQAALL